MSSRRTITTMKLFKKKQQQPVRRSSAFIRESSVSSGELDQQYSFRRNRTLTGSLASHVGSANESGSELKSSRVHAHELRRHRRKLFWLFVASAVVVAGLGYGIYNSIALPVVTADESIPASEKRQYEDGIQSYLGQHFFERSRLTLNTDRLTAYLQDIGNPEIEAVSSDMQFAGLGMSRLHLSFRQPVVSWRAGDTLLYVDAEGNAFERNYFAAPSVQVVDQTGIQAQNNRVLASNRFVGFIGRSIGQMKFQGYTPTRVTLPADTTHQIRISLQKVAYPVTFSVDRPAGEQAEDAARAIRYLERKRIRPDYLDVRVSGKAFYK